MIRSKWFKWEPAKPHQRSEYRAMTDDEVRAFDAAFEKMDDAFSELRRAFDKTAR